MRDRKPKTAWVKDHGKRRLKLTYYALGQRRRKFFQTEAECQAFQASQTQSALEHGADLSGVTGPERSEMVAFWLKMKAMGMSPFEVLEAALKQRKTSPLTPAVVEDCLAAKQKAKRRERYLRQLRYTLRSFARMYPLMMIHQHTGKTLEAWANPPLNAKAPHAPDNPSRYAAHTVRSRESDLRTLFAYAEAQDHLQKNPTAQLETVSADNERAHPMTVEQAQKLMDTVLEKDPGLAPFFAGCLFCYIRPEEMRKVTKEMVRLDEGLIDLPANITKTHTPRLVPIQPAAMKWFELGGDYQPKNMDGKHGRFTTVRQAAGLFADWKHDWMRKTGVSMRLAQTENEHKTAYEAGHSVDTLNFWYKGTARKGQAEKFFAIVPPAGAAQKVASFFAARQAVAAERLAKRQEQCRKYAFKAGGANPMKPLALSRMEVAA